jgi:hypothetical protein
MLGEAERKIEQNVGCSLEKARQQITNTFCKLAIFNGRIRWPRKKTET